MFSGKSKLLSAVLILVVFASGIYVGDFYSDRAHEEIETSLDVEKITAVYESVIANHVNEDIDTEAMLINAIKGMLKDVDGGLTRYQTAKEFEDSQRTSIRGDYAGIGLVIVANEDRMTVVAPYKNTPAERAGLQPGDVIIGVNGESIEGWSLDRVGETVRGPIGTDVELTILPANKSEPYNVVITRETIEVPVVSQQMVGSNNNIGHVSLYIFNSHSVDQLQEAIDTCLANGAEYLLLDLRGNPGGDLDACLGVADLFLEQGKTIFVTKDRHDNREVYQTRFERIYDIPVLLLIDKGSASASEVVTGALMDNGRAKSMGSTNSFGKASMQTGHMLNDGDFLWITTNTYLTPNGNYIDKVGIKPNYAIPEEITNSGNEKVLEYIVKWVEEQLR